MNLIMLSLLQFLLAHRERPEPAKNELGWCKCRKVELVGGNKKQQWGPESSGHSKSKKKQ